MRAWAWWTTITAPQAVKVREAFDAIAANINTFTPSITTTSGRRSEDVRTGKIDAAVIIPAQYSRRVYAQDAAADRAGGG